MSRLPGLIQDIGNACKQTLNVCSFRILNSKQFIATDIHLWCCCRSIYGFTERLAEECEPFRTEGGRSSDEWAERVAKFMGRTEGGATCRLSDCITKAVGFVTTNSNHSPWNTHQASNILCVVVSTLRIFDVTMKIAMKTRNLSEAHRANLQRWLRVSHDIWLGIDRLAQQDHSNLRYTPLMASASTCDAWRLRVQNAWKHELEREEKENKKKKRRSSIEACTPPFPSRKKSKVEPR